MEDLAEDAESDELENSFDETDDEDRDDEPPIVSAPTEQKEPLVAPEFVDTDKEQQKNDKENKTVNDANCDSRDNTETTKEKKYHTKKQKKTLSEREFLTILLEPHFDAKVMSFLWQLMKSYYRVFRIRFDHTVVEGIHLEYNQMGFLQGLSGALTANVKLLKNWEFRMDWCHDQKPRIEGALVLYITGARIAVAVYKTIFYAVRIFLMYWKNKKRMLSNPGTFRLIFWRRWIVNFMTAES